MWQRVAIVGLSGAGKTTLGRGLAQKWGYPLVELDQLLWQPGWKPTPLPQLLPLAENLLSQPCWITDNQFVELRPLLWARAQVIIWLDYSPAVCFPRTGRRILQDWWHGREVCNGNRYNWQAIAPLWRWTQHIRRTEPRQLDQLWQQYPHLQVVRLRSPAEARIWQENLTI